MKLKTGMALLLSMGLMGSLSAMAQDDTMEVIDDDTVVEDLVNPIALPDSASETGVENSAFGLDTANRAREDGRAFGQQQAEEARARGQEARDSAGQSARDAAMERARGGGGPGAGPGAGGPPTGGPGAGGPPAGVPAP